MSGAVATLSEQHVGRSLGQSRFLAASVQTSTDVFTLFNELKSGAFVSDNETAAARFGAVMALEQCANFTKPHQFALTLQEIQALPEGHPKKALRLKAYQFDLGRCKGFEGWTAEQLVSNTNELLHQAAKLGSPAARMRLAANRFFDEGLRKPESRDAIIQEIARISPSDDPAVINEAVRFLEYFRHSYAYVSESSHERYGFDLVEAALFSLGCDQGALCAWRNRGTNTQGCWANGDCRAQTIDEFIQQERLPPAQYERYLALRQELQAAIADGGWPAGFWRNVTLPNRIGTAARQ